MADAASINSHGVSPEAETCKQHLRFVLQYRLYEQFVPVMENPQIEICGISGVNEKFPFVRLPLNILGISPGRRRSMAMTDHY
jgi:hypothetical protein